VIGKYTIGFAFKLAAISGAIILGIGAAYQGFAVFGNRAVAGNPMWTERVLNPQDKALPYVLGHYMARGQLPPPLAVQDYLRQYDEDGNVLDGDCVIEVKGEIPLARWWTLSAVNENSVASLDSNTLTSGTAVLEADDTLILRISNSPQPGNWIKPPSNGNYRIAFAVHEAVENRSPTFKLPQVRQVGC
jgi:hypothetical protein